MSAWTGVETSPLLGAQLGDGAEDPGLSLEDGGFDFTQRDAAWRPDQETLRGGQHTDRTSATAFESIFEAGRGEQRSLRRARP
jgi:hypothetical protein